mgnify:FL=1
MTIFSPAKKKKVEQKTMSFPEAIAVVIKGVGVRRVSWPQEEYGLLKDGFLTICKNGFHRWIISDGDMTANDWVTVGGN